MPPGRPHGLDQGDTREQLADLIVSGLSGPEIAEILGRHPDTIKYWRHDDIVEQLVAEKRRARVNQFVSRIDAELEERLENIGDLTITELLKIRQTVQPRAAEREGPDPEKHRRDWLTQDAETAKGETVPIPNG